MPTTCIYTIPREPCMLFELDILVLDLLILVRPPLPPCLPQSQEMQYRATGLGFPL